MPLEDLIAKVEADLDKLAVKPSSPTAVRALLTRLDSKIREAQEKGYSVQEIVDLIAQHGVDVEAVKLKERLAAVLEKKRKKSSARRRSSGAKKSGTQGTLRVRTDRL
jgi:recombinational DNA repair ATPase RecF